MRHVAFFTGHDRWPWFRQTPGGSGRWGDVQFHFCAEPAGCDWLVVYDDLREPVETRVPWERRIAVVSEPPGIKDYRHDYLSQFGVVLSPVVITGLKGQLIVSQPGINWYFGAAMTRDGTETRYDYDALKNLPVPSARQPGVSIVCSKKSKLPMHRERLAFIDRLTAHLGDRAHIFGKGFQEIADKAEAVLPFRYHIALENNVIDHFWTEKIADPFLGWAYPLYSGCRNLTDYFPEASFARIDVSDPDRAARDVGRILDEDPYERHLEALKEARLTVLDQHNIFAVLANLTNTEAREGSDAGTATIRPSKTFGIANQAKAVWKAVLGKSKP